MRPAAVPEKGLGSERLGLHALLPLLCLEAGGGCWPPLRPCSRLPALESAL